MRILLTMVCLVLLPWVAPASAQSTYALTVTRHRSIALSEEEVDKILAAASRLLKIKDGPNDVACDVTFKRNGPVKTFASRDTPAVITDEESRDAVHAEDADVKVVDKIGYCRPGLGTKFDGCTWPPRLGRRSMIVVRFPADPFPGILWAHEFGHRTGLRHRSEPWPVMTGCRFDGSQVHVSRDECNCFLAGPGKCVRQDPPRPCDR